MHKEISRGAEAVIFLDKNKVIKERIKKSYRYFKLDIKLRTNRTKREVNLLKKSSEIVNVPKVMSYNDTQISMEFIKGDKISEFIDKANSKELDKFFLEIGKCVAKLHNKDVIHNDLTTANILFKEDKIYFIDFGLGFISNKIEDKAYDLHLLNQALKSRHFSKSEKLFTKILDGYAMTSNNFREIKERLNKIGIRGRYKRKNKG